MTILNTIELTETSQGVAIAGTICIVIFLLSIIIGVSTCNSVPSLSTFCVFTFFMSLVGILVCVNIDNELVVPNGKYQYEIIVDDSVTFNELTEKYNIIEQRGEIFVVEEKE